MRDGFVVTALDIATRGVADGIAHGMSSRYSCAG